MFCWTVPACIEEIGSPDPDPRHTETRRLRCLYDSPATALRQIKAYRSPVRTLTCKPWSQRRQGECVPGVIVVHRRVPYPASFARGADAKRTQAIAMTTSDPGLSKDALHLNP